MPLQDPSPAAMEGDATLLQQLFEHALEGICVFDAGWLLAAWNERYVEMSGLPRERVRRGATARELMLELARAGLYGPGEAEAQVEQRLAEMRQRPSEVFELRRPDGRVLELRRNALPDGGFFTLFADITGRRATESALADQQRMFALLLQSTEQGVWFIDNALATTDANPAMCRMLGLGRAQLLGRSIYEFVDAENEAIFREHVKARAQGRAEAYEITLTRADGTPVHCWNNATPIYDAQGRKAGAVGLFSDISVLKQAQQELERTGSALRDKSRALELTLEALEQGVVMFGPDGLMRAWNHRAQALLELPDFLMQPATRIDDMRDFQARHGLLPADMLPAGGMTWPPRERLYRRTRRDGRVLEVRTHEAQDGSMVRTYTDVTAEQRAQEALAASERRFRTMADAAPAFIWESDAQGQPRWFNQRWLDTLGRSLEQELALPWGERMHADDLERARLVFYEAAQANQPYRVEFRVRAGAGWLWLEDHGMPQRTADGGFEGFLAYGWDVTARKAAESALIAARDEAERANRAKSEFLSRMSHELRTPLNAVLGFAQLMQADVAEPLGQGQRSRLAELQRGGRHLLALINDVLDLSRIEAGRLQLALAPVDAQAVLGECLQLMAATAAARSVTLQPPPPPPQPVRLQADATRLMQVLLNLLGNAIKYNRPGGAVVLHWSRHGHHQRLSIHDEGPGLSEAQQARLFQPFERLGAERGAVEGAGIGLALSRWLVELMGGRIGVDSRVGQGSCFWVELADAGGQPEGAAPSHEPIPAIWTPTAAPLSAPGLREQRVLHVEDNEVNRLLMMGMLARVPALRLDLAATPAEGLAMAAAARPDLLLLDIQLPEMDGHALLAALRALPGLAGVPAVAVSANAMPEDRERARAAGFDGYITKPVDLAALQATVLRLLGR